MCSRGLPRAMPDSGYIIHIGVLAVKWPSTLFSMYTQFHHCIIKLALTILPLFQLKMLSSKSTQLASWILYLFVLAVCAQSGCNHDEYVLNTSDR